MEENIFDLLNEYFDSKIQLNLVKECKITSMQAKEGTNLEMEIARKRVCDKCFGEAGKKENCKDCEGRGFNIFTEIINVTIPPKVKNNDKIVIKNKGNILRKEGTEQTEVGNLELVLKIYGNHSKREGKIIEEDNLENNKENNKII